ncbi:MAG: hypothetical protein Q9183_002059 [Haloplaca sp. 2 TL-2023]
MDPSSFCRKTTLTKHFKRYHPIKAEDSGMPDVGEEEDAGAESDEEETCSEPDGNRQEGSQMSRQSSYYGDHWPLPCATANALPGQLALRPKSTVDRVKYERPRSVSPQMIRSVPSAEAPTSTFSFPRGRTTSIQTQMNHDFHQIPMPDAYVPEPRVDEAGSPCHFPTENNMDALTSPTRMQSSPTNYSDMSSAPDSAHPTLFYPGPTSQPYVPQNEPSSMGFPSTVPAEEVPMDAGQQTMYDADYKPMIQAYDVNALAAQQQMIQPLGYYDGVSYQMPMEQYYGPAPAWLDNIKPEDSWPGPSPSQRLNTIFNSNQ